MNGETEFDEEKEHISKKKKEKIEDWTNRKWMWNGQKHPFEKLISMR